MLVLFPLDPNPMIDNDSTEISEIEARIEAPYRNGRPMP
jgi:hypothetical protein